ncbi:MAG: alpha/beta hydrolase [Sphingobacteriales bacterium]|nr:alpha/beta hydrolase [Sphingobacteriales bacterium]
MKKIKINPIVFFITFLSLNSACTKTLDDISNITDSNQLSKPLNEEAIINARKAVIDSFLYFANLVSPSRDIDNFDNIYGDLQEVNVWKNTIETTTSGGGGNNGDCYELPACNGITFPLQPGWACDVIPPKDTFNNIINAFGQYGTDIRQQYVVHYPANKNSSSPIIILVHGGGWFSGPNPDELLGWHFGFTTNKPNNFVKNLLDSGFVVVNLLYRLTRYGDVDADITTNPIPIQDQISDINSGILHIRSNFPTCLGLNANSIQVLGESAGGHLVLSWAYANASTSYIKSVVSMYAPTNMQQYGNYLKNIPTYANFTCGNAFNGFPWYFPIVNIYNPYMVYNTTNFNCQALTYPNSRVLQSYKLIQSLVKTIISAPLSSSELFDVSPCNILNSARIIPTFIMHGKNDVFVPKNQATNKMDTTLTNNGGLLFNINSSGGSVPTSYTSNLKHGIKYYDYANHSWETTNTIFAPQSTLYSLIRTDAIKWLNGHK